MTADRQLWTRLHNYGLGEWIRRANRDEMLRVAQACVDALDEIQKLDADAANERAEKESLRDQFRAFKETAIEESRAADVEIERLQNARLDWAMSCPCDCAACIAFDEVVQQVTRPVTQEK